MYVHTRNTLLTFSSYFTTYLISLLLLSHKTTFHRIQVLSMNRSILNRFGSSREHRTESCNELQRSSSGDSDLICKGSSGRASNSTPKKGVTRSMSTSKNIFKTNRRDRSQRRCTDIEFERQFYNGFIIIVLTS